MDIYGGWPYFQSNKFPRNEGPIWGLDVARVKMALVGWVLDSLTRGHKKAINSPMVFSVSHFQTLPVSTAISFTEKSCKQMLTKCSPSAHLGPIADLRFPVETVNTMRRIVEEAEHALVSELVAAWTVWWGRVPYFSQHRGSSLRLQLRWKFWNSNGNNIFSATKWHPLPIFGPSAGLEISMPQVGQKR